MALTAGVAVFDRHTGRFTEQVNPDLQFRSASVVKLLIVLDYLWDRGPAYDVPADDRARLDVMLRSSDDNAASYYWDELGGGPIVDRMVTRLGLTHTARPPATHPGFWGYVAITAADTVRIYRYLLEQAPAAVREYVMGNLYQPTRCGTDGFDQYFGIASVFDLAFSVKQGWSGFVNSRGPRREVGGIDLTSEALHTTGTVGTGDRSIVAVYTLHPNGTAYGKAYTDLTRLTRGLTVPGGLRAEGTWLPTTGSEVRVRTAPNTSGGILAVLPSAVEVLVGCQTKGERIEAPLRSSDDRGGGVGKVSDDRGGGVGKVSEWWSYLPKYGGYVTNVYVGSGSDKLPGVPDCG